METSELLEIMNGRFDKIDYAIQGLVAANCDAEKECRKRHTDIDKDVQDLKTRTSWMGILAAAIGGALGYGASKI